MKPEGKTSLTDIPVSCLQQLPKPKQIFIPTSGCPPCFSPVHPQLPSTASEPPCSPWPSPCHAWKMMHQPPRWPQWKHPKMPQIAPVPEDPWWGQQRLAEPGWPQWLFGKGQGGIQQWGDTQVWVRSRKKPVICWDVEDVDPISGFCGA